MDLGPDPLTLLPAARSPSRPHYCEPLVGSYPTVSALTLARTLSQFFDKQCSELCSGPGLGRDYFLLRL